MSSPGARRITMLVRNPFTHDTRVERQARTLTDAGYEVTVVADAAPGVPATERRAGATVRRIRRRGPNVPGLRFVLHQLRLRRALRRTRAQILTAHDADALVSVGAVARRTRVPLVYDSHELWLGLAARGRSRAYDRLSRLWYGWVERRYVPLAAAVMVANPGVGPELERRYGITGVRIVPNYPELDPDVAPRALRSLPGGGGLPVDQPIVLYIGTLMPDRGIEQAVAALTIVGDVHLACLGPLGSHAAAVRAEADRLGVGGRVHLIDAVPSTEVVPYAASATIGISVVQPTSLSNRLALPNKLFQYMAAGLPVIASDFPDVREVVVGAGAGIVVDPTDVGALADALRGLLDDPDLRSAMGEAGRRAIRERFNWSVSARELLDAYSRAGATA